jgi:hypothetical protein
MTKVLEQSVLWKQVPHKLLLTEFFHVPKHGFVVTGLTTSRPWLALDRKL